MAMLRSKKRSDTVFSREEIGVEQLQSLKEKFADGDLTEQEFVRLIREIVATSRSESQLAELFQKIDANSDGTVDWDELTNYMFLSGSDEFAQDDGNSYYDTAYPETFKGDLNTGNGLRTVTATDAMGNLSKGTTTLGLGFLPYHKDLITRVVRLERPNVYLTTSKDGTIRTWNAHSLAPQQLLASGRDWLTDCCVMKRSNRLAVSSMNRTLSFYDLNSGQILGELVEYSQRQCIPLCLAYVERPSDNREALVIGDDTGGIAVFTCSDQWLACDGRSTAPTSSTIGTNNSLLNTLGTSALSSGSEGADDASQSSNSGNSAMLEFQGFSSRAKLQKHTDWITRVKWVHDMRAVVATSLDGTVSILDVDQLVVKFEYTRHQGVFDLAWCASTRLIASCGKERDIHIWNPYSSQRAVATLKGHTSSVLHLVSDDDKFQIVSAAADNIIKVWDVRNHRCLQTFAVDGRKESHVGGCALHSAHKKTAASPRASNASNAKFNRENQVSALLFDGKYPCLMTATTQLTRWTMKDMDTTGLQGEDETSNETPRAHRQPKLRRGVPTERPVRLSCYNNVFHQVLTASMDAASEIKTWSAETGDEISCFTHAHGANPVTSIAFDHAGRRLVTGSHDGERLKMWNFSNGSLVKQFHKKEPPIVSSVAVTASPATARSTAPVPDDTFRAQAPSPRGRRDKSTLMTPSEWRSPTRLRLQQGRGQLSPAPPASQTPRPQSGNAASRPSSRSQMRAMDSSRPVQGPDTCYYRQHEVTSIIDVERNVRVGMGDFVCQRFVCSVGWDRKLYVWADKSQESEALPLHVLPSDSVEEGDNDDHQDKGAEVDRTKRRSRQEHHTMDVLTLAYLPPTYVATAGLDGLVLLWSLNSGELVAPLYQNSGSIETLWYAEKLELLFAAGERGVLLCFDRSMTTRAEIPLDIPLQNLDTWKPTSPPEAVTALRCDKANTHLVSGDTAGGIKVWELRLARNHEGVELALVCTWRLNGNSSSSGSSRRVLCIDLVDTLTRVSELFLVVSCADGDVSLWTLDGVHVGSFGGRHRTWQLGRPLTYASLRSCCEWEWLPSSLKPRNELESHKETQSRDVRTKNDIITKALESPRCVFIKNCALGALPNAMAEPHEKVLQDDTMPKPGEVWMCVASHRARAAVPNGGRKPEDPDSDPDVNGPLERHDNSEPQTLASLAFLRRKLAQVNGEVTELVTIVKVTRGEILCWDALTPTPLDALKVLELRELVRKAGWSKHVLLSQFIGRTFVDLDKSFQVAAILMHSMDPIKGEQRGYALLDSNAVEHELQPLNDAISSVRFKLLESFRNEALPRQLSSPRPPTTQCTLQAPSVAAPVCQDVVTGSSIDLPSLTGEELPLGHRHDDTKELTLPFIRPREKRVMGGQLPKRSSARSQLDAAADIRRIHTPDDVPKNFRVMLQHKRGHNEHNMASGN